MKTFSPSEAAFEGFRLIGRRPGLIVVWSLLHLVLTALVLAIVWGVMAPELPSILSRIAAASAAPPGEADPSWAIPLMIKMRALQWTIQPLAWLAAVIFTCAIYRALLRPQERGFAYLRLGGDEFRLIAVAIVYAVLVFVAILVLAVAGGILGVALYFGTVKSAGGAASGWFAAGLTVLICAFLCLAVWLGVKLSLAWPISFAEKRIALFDSWQLTRGNFWRILGTYLLAFIFAMVLGMVVVMVFGIALLFSAGSLAGMVHSGEVPDWNRLAPVLIPLGVVWILVASVMGAISRVVLTAPGAAIYRELTGAPADGEARAQGLVL
jgi:hypothetical protein